MSFQAETWVIQKSMHKGANLLVLLMIANHAHADGTGAYPSIATLAKECRMSERQIRRIVEKLEASGELAIEQDAGPRGVNRYSLPKMSAPQADKMSSKRQRTGQGVRTTSGQDVPTQDQQPDILSSSTGHLDTPLPDIAMSPKQPREQSENRSHRVGDSDTSPQTIPPPTAQINRKPSPLPENFGLTADQRTHAEQQRPDLDIEATLQKFRVHFRGGAQRQNWLDEWEKWLLNERGTLKRSSPAPARASPRAPVNRDIDTGPAIDKTKLLGRRL